MPENKRSYASQKRKVSADATRDSILAAAAELLDGSEELSMEAVARASCVTRLTVYNQFGSRGRLLEAVFDARAVKGGIKDLAQAVTHADPLQGFDSMIETLCRFWAKDPVIWAVQDAAGTDSELRAALESRQARRREVIDALLGRMNGCENQKRNAGDLIFAIVSLPTVRSLLPGRTPEQCADLLRLTVRAVLGSSGLQANP